MEQEITLFLTYRKLSYYLNLYLNFLGDNMATPLRIQYMGVLYHVIRLCRIASIPTAIYMINLKIIL